MQFQSFGPAHRSVVPLDDRNLLSEKIGHRIRNQFLSHVHCQRQRLQNEMVTVAVDDYAGQSVALAPNQAAKSIVYSAPFTIFGRLRDPAFEKIEIKVLLPSREAPRHNLRLGIIDRAADQMIAPILERNNVAVRRFTENLQHFAREYPIVPVENAGPRFDDDSSHALMMSHLCRALHNRLSIFPE